jgi:hypothetical protein
MAGFENGLYAGEHLATECAEFRATVINRGQAHRAKDPIRDRAGPWDLQEVPPAGMKIELDHDGYRKLL